MKIDIVSIFPGMFPPVFGVGIVHRAVRSGLLELNPVDLRDFAHDVHRTVDDRPFGGGEGMVFKPEPLAEAIRVLQAGREPKPHVIFLTPQGRVLTQGRARELAEMEHLVLLCGRYEGVDQRIVDLFVDEEISIGDYVLSGGEIPAMVLVDTIARLLPGAVGHPDSTRNESFEDSLLDYPVYTRPAVFEGLEVPEALLSGNHREIASWRREQALKKTRASRPDLLRQRAEIKNKRGVPHEQA